MNTFQLDEREVESIKHEKCFLNGFSDKDGLMSVDRKILNKYPKLKNVCITHTKSFILMLQKIVVQSYLKYQAYIERLNQR